MTSSTRKTERSTVRILLMSLCLMAVCTIYLVVGPAGFHEVSPQLLIRLRLGRLCSALVIGASLALSGGIIQRVLHNPMASPSVLGISSGAGLGCVLWSLWAPAFSWGRPLASFLGAVSATGLMMMAASRLQARKTTLVLIGLALSSVFSALIDLAISFSDQALSSYGSFKVGSLASASFQTLALPALGLMAVLIFSLLCSCQLEVLSLGNDQARLLGLKTGKWQMLFLGAAALSAALSVSAAGMISFVGLLVPNIAGRFSHKNLKEYLLECTLAGALCLSLCDLLARIIIMPKEIPVGILLSLFGGLFFIGLLFERKRRHYD